MPLVDQVLRDCGFDFTPTDTTPEAAPPAPAPAGGTGDAETAQPNEIPAAPLQAPPPPRYATAAELFTWIKRCIMAQTHLPEDAAELIVFFVVSTWFQDILTVLPCIVLTGSAHEASRVLRALGNFCREPKLLSGFRRSHLGVLHWGSKTNLISEPNLDRRTAALLSNLTDKNFMVVERGWLISCAKSTAIYTGENPETHKIQNSIHIHIPPTNAEPSAPPQWLQKMIERVPVHLSQYRDQNLSYAHRWTWTPSGLPCETATIATELGRPIVDAPELRQKLVALLKTQDKLRLSEMSDTIEAIVLEATRTLCREGRESAYAREIAAAANHLLEARGETARLRPEHVGHVLKRFGLRTHPLSQTGRGLNLDRAAIARIEQLCAAYGMEDTPAETENLHGSQTTEN
ncbi:MAG: hypothetical protein ABSB50_17680 [Terracidiphilus sp.]|jgi:hypothetical protein